MIETILKNYALRNWQVRAGSFMAYCAIENAAGRSLDSGRRKKLEAIYERPERC